MTQSIVTVEDEVKTLHDIISRQGHKREIITIFHKFKKLEKRFSILIRNMQDTIKSQIELLELKMAISDVKHTMK